MGVIKGWICITCVILSVCDTVAIGNWYFKSESWKDLLAVEEADYCLITHFRGISLGMTHCAIGAEINNQTTHLVHIRPYPYPAVYLQNHDHANLSPEPSFNKQIEKTALCSVLFLIKKFLWLTFYATNGWNLSNFPPYDYFLTQWRPFNMHHLCNKTYIERLINQYYKTIFLNQNLHWNMWSNQHGELFPKHLVLTPLFEAKLTIDCKINIQNEIEMLGNTD